MKKPLIWAHRGASGYEPENTIQSFKRAIEMGADGIELDIQLSEDGEIVVIHDEMIDRTSDGEGWVKDYTLEELRQFDYNYQNHTSIGSAFGREKEKKGERVYTQYDRVDIPTMREVFELIKPTDLTINIELKTGIIFYPDIEEKILDMTDEYGMLDRVIFSSFNHSSVKLIKELRPEAQCGFLYGDGTIGMPQYAVTHGVDALHPALYNIQYTGFIEDCKRLGVRVHTWTVNEEGYMAMCARTGVDAIITNYPDIARRVVDSIE